MDTTWGALPYHPYDSTDGSNATGTGSYATGTGSLDGSQLSSIYLQPPPGPQLPPPQFASGPTPTPSAPGPLPVPPPTSQPQLTEADVMRELFTAVVNNNRVMEQHTATLTQLEAQIRDANTTAAQARVQAQAAAAVAPSSAAPATGRVPTVKVREPQYFTGKADHVEKFIREVQTNVNLQRAAFPRDSDKVDYMSMYLGTGTPQSWFTAVQRTKPVLLANWEAFKTEFIQRFQTTDLIGKYTRRIEALSQKGSAADFANQYVECLAYIDWSEQVKINQFTRRLKPDLRKLLVNIKRPATLDEWIPIVVEADNNLHELEIELKRDEKRFKPGTSQRTNGPRLRYDPPAPPAPSSTGSGSSEPTPMEVDATRQGPRGPLTPEEKERRRMQKLCFYCGAGNHQFKDCPNRRNAKAAPSTGKA